jgi:hypothetical protein
VRVTVRRARLTGCAARPSVLLPGLTRKNLNGGGGPAWPPPARLRLAGVPGVSQPYAHAAAAAKISLNFAAANLNLQGSLPGLAPIEVRPVPRSELQVGSGFPDFQWNLNDAGPGRRRVPSPLSQSQLDDGFAGGPSECRAAERTAATDRLVLQPHNVSDSNFYLEPHPSLTGRPRLTLQPRAGG